MSLVTLVLLLATTSLTLTRSQETEISVKGLNATQPPIKLDKNLRRALLRALTDLEAESAEQHKGEKEFVPLVEANFDGISKKNLNDDLGVRESMFSFKSFPRDEELPPEDKLQNSSFVESVRYVTLQTPVMNIAKATQEESRSFHVQNVIIPEKSVTFGTKIEPKAEQEEKKSPPSPGNTFSVSKVESLTLKPATELSESLAGSATNGIATANALVAQKSLVEPTVATPINNATASSDQKDKTEEVKIFQAPLVAAFTVQQDEQGVPKSVVPIFRSPNDLQALTLQEQLEFKQHLLEKQLAELQQQQIQQTQFLVRQQHLYEQQLRQKQAQQYYLQEQARIKQLEEQAKLKRLEEQRIKQLEEQRIKQLEEQRIKQLEEQRIKQFEEQRLNRFQLQRPAPQKQFFFEQNSNLVSFQPPANPNVHLQPSVALEVPNEASPLPFQSTFQDQLRYQSFRQQPQQTQHFQQPQPAQQLQQPQQVQTLQQTRHLQQTQQLPLHQPQQLQQQQHQQRLQHSFPGFTDFQSSLPSTTRFNRQEAFNAVGNFGFNVDHKATSSRNNFGFTVPQRSPVNYYNPYVQYRQAKPSTPAKQIQHLLYQSGIASDLGSVQGTGNHEDLNIVSKVLALNVGHVPNKNFQFKANPTASFGKASA